MVSPTDMVIRLLLGAVLGGIIGYERQVHGRAAGFRTHMLVCIASVLIMEVSEYYYHLSTLDSSFIRIDPARIAAGAITGIGFIGAGVIVKTGATVQGLTTAASLWMVAAIGLALGSGMLIPATAAFGLTFINLFMLRAIERRADVLIFKNVHVTAEININDTHIMDVLKNFKAHIQNTDFDIDNEKGELMYRLTIAVKGTKVLRPITEELAALEGVKKVTLRS